MSYNIPSRSSNYPLMSQSEWDAAPFNQEENTAQKVKVTVSVTISKTVEVEVSDYTVEKEMNEEGLVDFNYDFSDCDLRAAVRQQINLPEDSKEFKDWIVDDFEVMLDQ